jgi:hypothetical protein
VQQHLLLMQECVKRELNQPYSGDLLDSNTADLGRSLGLSDNELETLQLVEKQMVIQTLIFEKTKFESVKDVKKWITDHGFKVLSDKKEKEDIDKAGIDETETSFRVRQLDPEDFKEGTLRTIQITDGVKAVVGELKEASKKIETNKNLSTFETRLLPIDKAEDDKRIVLGIALEPDEVDTQGDTESADEIEIAAHRWLAQFQDRGFMHKQIVNSKIEIYESYIAPVDLTIGKQEVKKGSWLLMYHIIDDTLWTAVKNGEITGFSIGGFARRVKT